jgi:glutaredoxin 2
MAEAFKSKKKAYKNVLARLFAPTANFLARMTNHSNVSEKLQAGKSNVLRQSMMERILKSPQVGFTTG